MARIQGESGQPFSPNTPPAWSTEGGRRDMIRVTRLSGEVLYLNILQIESMESIPETKIKMMNGYYYLVKDTADSVVEQLRAFYQSCIVPDGVHR